jgi:outer membrane protein assembly factor BamA
LQHKFSSLVFKLTLKPTLFIFLLLFGLLPQIKAQQAFRLRFILNDSLVSSSNTLRILKSEKNLNSSASINKEIQKTLPEFYALGHLSARIDSIVNDSIHTACYLFAGKQYYWAHLDKGNVDEGILSAIGFRERFFSKKPFNYKEIERLNTRIIGWCENNGYPFASIKLDSVSFNGDNSITAVLTLQKNQKTIVDSISIRGSSKLNQVYFYNYIGIKPGDLYNEAQFKRTSARVKELPFISESRPFEIIFTEKENKAIFFLEDRQANQADGILGILPDDANPGKVLLTGDLQLKLLNSFGNGELIDLNWRKLQSQTSDLRTQFVYPFIFSTPFGVEGKLDIYKRDTTFLNVNSTAGIQYILTGANFFRVFVTRKGSSIQSTHGLEYLTFLPPYADVRTTLYGIGYKYEHLDYRLNPTKGVRLITNASAGNRKILKHPKINPELYENISLNTIQYDLNFTGDLFLPTSSRSTIRLANNSGWIANPGSFENELYRIGGLRTLRGFDEESIFASAYSIMTIEARYLLEQNSFAHLFWNGAWYENNSSGNYKKDIPWGFGAGMSFETKAGIFSISYALGKQLGNPFQMRTGKIHFGIVSLF